MKELIDRILETEKQAHEQVEAARRKAAELQKQADGRISREKAELKKEDREMTLKALEAARDEVRALSARSLPEGKAALLEELGISEEQFSQTVNVIVSVLTTAGQKDT